MNRTDTWSMRVIILIVGTLFFLYKHLGLPVSIGLGLVAVFLFEIRSTLWGWLWLIPTRRHPDRRGAARSPLRGSPLTRTGEWALRVIFTTALFFFLRHRGEAVWTSLWVSVAIVLGAEVFRAFRTWVVTAVHGPLTVPEEDDLDEDDFTDQDDFPGDPSAEAPELDAPTTPDLSSSPVPAGTPWDHPVKRHFVRLGIDMDSTPAEVSTAYQALARSYHPDRFVTLPLELQQVAEHCMAEIDEAYAEIQRYQTPAEHLSA